jgi:hypothetical protein
MMGLVEEGQEVMEKGATKAKSMPGGPGIKEPTGSS